MQTLQKRTCDFMSQSVSISSVDKEAESAGTPPDPVICIDDEVNLATSCDFAVIRKPSKFPTFQAFYRYWLMGMCGCIALTAFIFVLCGLPDQSQRLAICSLTLLVLGVLIQVVSLKRYIVFTRLTRDYGPNFLKSAVLVPAAEFTAVLNLITVRRPSCICYSGTTETIDFQLAGSHHRFTLSIENRSNNKMELSLSEVRPFLRLPMEPNKRDDLLLHIAAELASEPTERSPRVDIVGLLPDFSRREHVMGRSFLRVASLGIIALLLSFLPIATPETGWFAVIGYILLLGGCLCQGHVQILWASYLAKITKCMKGVTRGTYPVSEKEAWGVGLIFGPFTPFLVLLFRGVLQLSVTNATGSELMIRSLGSISLILGLSFLPVFLCSIAYLRQFQSIAKSLKSKSSVNDPPNSLVSALLLSTCLLLPVLLIGYGPEWFIPLSFLLQIGAWRIAFSVLRHYCDFIVECTSLDTGHLVVAERNETALMSRLEHFAKKVLSISNWYFVVAMFSSIVGTLWLTGGFAFVLHHYDEAIAMNPRWAEPYFAKAKDLEDRNQLREALNVLSLAVAHSDEEGWSRRWLKVERARECMFYGQLSTGAEQRAFFLQAVQDYQWLLERKERVTKLWSEDDRTSYLGYLRLLEQAHRRLHDAASLINDKKRSSEFIMKNGDGRHEHLTDFDIMFLDN